MSTRATQQISEEMQECIQDCLDCYRTCLETIAYCLQQGGKHSEASHVQLLTDCADVCLMSANSMLHGSNRHKRSCALCAEVCEQCADDCAKFGKDATMHACVEACRRCAESCRKMAV